MNNKYNLSAKEQLNSFIRLIKYLKYVKGYFMAAMFFLLLMTTASATAPYVTKVYMDKYVAIGNYEVKSMVLVLILFVVIQLIYAISSYFGRVFFSKGALIIVRNIRNDLFRKIQQLGMSYFDRTSTGSIVSRLTNDTEALSSMFTTALEEVLKAFVLVIVSFIAMFLLDVHLALITLCALPIILLAIYLYRLLSVFVMASGREKLSELNTKLSEVLEGIKIVQIFNQEKRLVDEFEKTSNEYFNFGIKEVKINAIFLLPAVSLLQAVMTAIILEYFGILSFSGSIKIGTIYAFSQYVSRFFNPISEIMQQLSVFQTSIVAADRIFKVLDLEEAKPKQKEKKDLKITNGDIVFENVSFGYTNKQKVLKNISFSAKKGQTIALVGHTGSGKSSIINLFMRFYEFNEGNIYIDGVNIKDYSYEELRNSIGLVLQEAFMFYGTIESNIRLHDEKLTFEQIKAAAEFVNVDEFIENLPKKYQNEVTERGTTLSTGQRQLLSFARVIIKNPKILVLDEATANIDSQTEEVIQNSLHKMREGRTTIAIAHRLSTIQDADQILVLHKGGIVESGTHEELLELKGRYYKMYQLQTKG